MYNLHVYVSPLSYIHLFFIIIIHHNPSTMRVSKHLTHLFTVFHDFANKAKIGNTFVHSALVDLVYSQHLNLTVAVLLSAIWISWPIYTGSQTSETDSGGEGVDITGHGRGMESEYPPGMQIDEVWKRKKWDDEGKGAE